MAELNDGSLSSTGQSALIHRKTNTESDQHFRAAFRAAHLSLIEAIAIAERLHGGSRTASISFDTSDNPSYRVRTVKNKEICGVSMPVFFIGLILIQYVGFKWALLPFTGRTGPVWDGGLPSLILPSLTLGAVLIGPIARLTRTAVLEVLGADFVRTARAKGLRESVVIIHHALRNAMIPVVTLIGLQAAFLLGGAVVTETMFSWPGVGRLAVGAIVSSDFPTAQGAIMILAVAFLSINLLVDVLYVYLDPRVQRR
jgi:ABC-type dipeptide/oligopeptide/nickel transport system permease component